MKTNITMHGSGELSLNFQNVEPLYNGYMAAVRRGKFDYLKEIAEENFIFRQDQLDELEEDFNAEIEEWNKE